MTLSSGTRLGPYEITAPLGAGGMGEVYRATDTNLKRAVAIKVLPESVAADAERLARFQREAEVLAALNHPHIAAIYGLERGELSTALVMELVEGPTLADCIGKGAMPVEETIAIAKQVAEALEAAHGQGIVHRDLKPANIKVRSDGTVKVLDFGLAKAMEPAGIAPAGAPTSPTITTPAMMTANGMLLGTVAYMSPEQARGKAVDKRTVAKSTAPRSLVWVNRDGTAGRELATIPPGTHEEPRLSPDGGRVVVTRSGDVWVYDIASGRSDRITDDGTSQMGVWNPTGSQIAYSSARKGNMEAWVESADGSGEPRQLTSLGGQVHVDSWSLDGRLMTMHHHPPQGPTAIYMLAMDRADAKPEPFLPGGSNKESAEFSRDREYVSYLSPETGQREIYVRPYQKSGLRITASVGGGREPVWARNGDLFYRSLNGEKMFTVSVKTSPTLNVGTPVQVFQGRYYVLPTGSPRAQYDVTADGQRFPMLAPVAAADSTHDQPRVVVVQRWFGEVMSKIPDR